MSRGMTRRMSSTVPYEDTRDDIDGEKTVGAPSTVLGLVVGRLVLEHTTSSSVGNKRNARDETEGKDRSGEDRACRETLDQRSDDDRANALSGIVGSGEDGDLLEASSSKSLVCLRNKRAVEVLQGELVHHDA
ncbi:hypothetical protein L1887_58859 [Cichorium endivia]|nr:hypothetical protein L1887_58859 [Cichorium endivia]